MNPQQRNLAAALSLAVIGLLAAWVIANQPASAPVTGELVTRSEPGLIAALSVAARVLGLVIDQAGVVVHVEAGSAAARAGVVTGDALVAIGDTQLTPQTLKSTEAISQLKTYIHNASESGKTDAKPIEITVSRKGALEKLRLMPLPPNFGAGGGDPSMPLPTATPLPDVLCYF